MMEKSGCWEHKPTRTVLYILSSFLLLDVIVPEFVEAVLVDDSQMLEISVHLIEVQTVSYHEDVRDGESHVIRLEPAASRGALLH
jgi:hypothetical protein